MAPQAKGFPILSDLRAEGVSPGTLPLRVIDWERPENRDFKADVIHAATEGQAELDLLLKRAAENFEFDLEDLECQRVEEASQNPGLEAIIDQVLANSPSTFLSEAGRRAFLPPISEKPHNGDPPVAGDSGICRGTHVQITAADNGSDVSLDAAANNGKASDELFAAAGDGKKAIGEVPVAADRNSASGIDASVNPSPDLVNDAEIDVFVASTAETSKILYSDIASVYVVDVEKAAIASEVDNNATPAINSPSANNVYPATASTADYQTTGDPSTGDVDAATTGEAKNVERHGLQQKSITSNDPTGVEKPGSNTVAAQKKNRQQEYYKRSQIELYPEHPKRRLQILPR